MKFFKRYFSSVDFNREQTKVACPFHKDEQPSASINTERSLFYCPVCVEGYNEVGFVAKVNDIPLVEAAKIVSKLEDTQTETWNIIEKAELWADQTFLTELRKLITDETIEKLNLGLTKLNGKSFLSIPIFYNNVLVDVKHYNLLKHSGMPKMMGKKGGENGYIFPYDIWKTDDRTTYIVEGEKDALVAREFGINAITLTGGAGSLPNKLVINAFKDKDVIVIYDNDSAGRSGAEGIFLSLRNKAKSVKYMDIADVVQKEKEDFADAVFKYGLDIDMFGFLPVYDFDEELVKDTRNYITMKDALINSQINKPIRSIINVSAEFEDVFALPIVAEIEKVARTSGDAKNSLEIGSKFTWYYDTQRDLPKLLELIEYDAKKVNVHGKIRDYIGIPKVEEGVVVNTKQTETVYKYKIMDANSRLVVNEDDEGGINNTMLDLYTFDKMEIGVEYDIEYKILPHPFRNQKLMAIAVQVERLDMGRDFTVDVERMKTMQTKGTVAERVETLFQSAKHHIAKHLNFDMWLMSDLVMNSILEIDYGGKTWGALDIFILGDTATGKSEVTKGLVDLYDFGHFLSLKTSTPIGLIGGSKKDGDSMVNTIGAIPRQHRKLVVMEEFSGAPPQFIKTMTDIRTTRRVHIIRVNGELNVACNLRMITISNPVGDERGLPKFLATFPNGVSPLMELINNPEDVGRYDGFILMPQIRERINPFLLKLEGKPIPQEDYAYKAKWVYTREAENVLFDEGVESYIWERAEYLNKRFESNFPLFGTKASIKLARFSVALASQILSVDESFQNIIVTKEIVDYIVNYFDKIYDNPLFKLRDYKVEYDSYAEVTKKDIKALQEIYPKHSNIIDFLVSTSSTSLQSLKANSALEGKDFSVLYTTLSQMKFIRMTGHSISPTMKLRRAYNDIDKTFTVGAGMNPETPIFVGKNTVLLPSEKEIEIDGI